MFYIYISEVYHFKLGYVVDIGLKVRVGCSLHAKYTSICVIRPISMHNYRSTCQQRLQKEEITQNRSDNDSLSFRSITKIAAIHNPHTTQKMTDRKQVVYRVVDHNYALESKGSLVRFPVEAFIFILNFSLTSRRFQLSEGHTNEINNYINPE